MLWELMRDEWRGVACGGRQSSSSLACMHTHTPDVLRFCAVDDMSSDLLIHVTTLTGQTDVLVSNTRTHPTRNSPAGTHFTSSVAALMQFCCTCTHPTRNSPAGSHFTCFTST